MIELVSSIEKEAKEAKEVKRRNFAEEAKEVLSFLNEKTSKRFKPVLVNVGFVMDRLKEGATVQDCKSVIAMKNREWGKDQDMRKYLRPSTLFNRTKFWQYEGELSE